MFTKRVCSLVIVLIFMFSFVSIGSADDTPYITLEDIMSGTGYNIEDYFRFYTVPLSGSSDSSRSNAGFAIVAEPIDSSEPPLYIFGFDKNMNSIIPENINMRAPTFSTYGAYVSTTPSWSSYTNEINGWKFYRNYRAKYSWYSNDTNVVVTRITVEYTTAGAKYNYPSCLTESLPSPFGSGNHVVSGATNNPVESTTYNTSSQYPSFAFGSSYNSGSDMTIKVQTTNGSGTFSAPCSPNF